MLKMLISIALCVLAIAACETLATVQSPPLVSALPVYKSTLVAQPAQVEIHEPTLAKVGDVVETVPTAISHQSSTIVHGKSQRITPLMTPAVRSYSSPAIHTFSASIPVVPLLRPLPLGFGGGSAAEFVHEQNPIQMRSFAQTPLLRSYGFNYGHPLVYYYATA